MANGVAWVQCESQAGCARCAAGEGCGAGLFARLLRGRLQELPVRLSASAAREPVPGEWVLIGLSTSAVQNASFLMYGLPLVGLLVGAVSGSIALGSMGLVSLALGNDLAALLGAVIGLVGGLALARRYAGRITDHGNLHPTILRTLRPEEPCPSGAEA